MVINRTTRLRWRRRLRHGRQQVEGMGTQAEERLERHFFKRLNRLTGLWRFITGWILLFILLAGGVIVQTRKLGSYYLIDKPVAGGTFVEGIVGSFTNANPLYATSGVDSSVSRLVFASLFKYDQNHQLVGDLADTWAIDGTGTKYEVRLRKDLVWQDGYPLTSADVVFTYATIQNPDVRSPLSASWRNITVTAKDPYTVEFDLPNTLSSFPYSMTNGIVPKHLLSGIAAAQLRSISFNTAKPVGAGPFAWDAVEVSGDTPETREQNIALVANEHYHSGKPKLGKFIIRSFRDENRLVDSFNKQELGGIAGLTNIPEDLNNDLNIREYNIPLLSEVMVFLRTSNDILKDVKVRRAITMATDAPKIAASLGHPVLPASGPLLYSQLGYDKALTQLAYNPGEAQKLLDEAGWPVGPSGIRHNGGKPLEFTLYTQNNREYTSVVQLLQKMWVAIGIDVKVYPQSDSELQTTISDHTYDSLVYGISLGVDPDVFAYWHSSQADVRSQNRLNFSEYRSTAADAALESGRTRQDPALRSVKYKPFLETWRVDAPAIALYQPRFLYLSRGQIFGFDPHGMTSGTDRYANVDNWMIREDKLLK